MKKVILFSFLVIFLISGTAYCGETITAREIDCYKYADGKMENLKEYMEITLDIDGNKVRKTRVYNLKRKKEIKDKTVYKIQKQLPSDLLDKGFKQKKPVIRAIGEPGFDSIEILVIGEKYIQTIKSSMDYFIISRFEIIK